MGTHIFDSQTFGSLPIQLGITRTFADQPHTPFLNQSQSESPDRPIRKSPSKTFKPKDRLIIVEISQGKKGLVKEQYPQNHHFFSTPSMVTFSFPDILT